MLTDAGVWGQAVLSTMNVGNCAVYYSWSRVQVGVEAARDKLQVLSSHFTCFTSTKKVALALLVLQSLLVARASKVLRRALDELQVLFTLLALLLHTSCLLY